MKYFTRHVLIALLIAWVPGGASFAESRPVSIAQFEQNGKIDSIDIASRKITIDGVDYQISEQAAVYFARGGKQPLSVSNAPLINGMRIGFKTERVENERLLQITEIMISNERGR